MGSNLTPAKRPWPASATRLLAVAVLAGPVGAFGGDACGQTLEEALAAAYRLNPALEASRASLRAVDEGVPQARAGYRPTVTAQGDIGRSENEVVSPFFGAREKRNPKNYRLSIEQPVYRGGRTAAGTRQAENLVQSGRARLLVTEQDVLLATATAYTTVLRDQAVLELTINNEQVLLRQLEATQDQFEVGEVTRTDVSQAEARLAGATAERIQAEGDLDSARAVYRNVIGESPGELVPPGPVEGLPATVEEAIALSEQNPDVAAALFSEKAALDGVDLVTGELLPEVSVVGEITRGEETSARGSLSKRKLIKAQLNVPLYQAGAVYSRVREARQNALQRRSEVEDARRDAGEAATRAWEALETARARILSFETQISANEIALEGVKQEATVGVRTILDILDAEQELLNSQVNLVRAQRDETVAAFELRTAIGRMTAAYLGLSVQLYDPESYYRKVRGKFWGIRVGDE